jgi:hypothetical protein
LFSDLVNLMSLVVCGITQGVNDAYRARAQQLNVSRTADYDKLNGVQPGVCAALVKETAAAMASLIEFTGGSSPKLLAPYKVRIIEGNVSRNRPSAGSVTPYRSCGTTGQITGHPRP